MARKRGNTAKRPIEVYEHLDKERLNNPPAGLHVILSDIDSGMRH